MKNKKHLCCKYLRGKIRQLNKQKHIILTEIIEKEVNAEIERLNGNDNAFGNTLCLKQKLRKIENELSAAQSLYADLHFNKKNEFLMWLEVWINE